MSKVYVAESIEDACQLLRTPGRVLCAGATNLYVDRYLGKQNACDIISIHKLKELRQITQGLDGWHIGALCTFDQLEQYFKEKKVMSALSVACSLVGGPQVRNRGTIGGNIVSASPSADSVPVLMAWDASVVLRSLFGERRMAIKDFMTGVKQTAIHDDEILTEVIIPNHAGQTRFRKVGKRNALAISICNVAIYASVSPICKNRLEEIAIAIGSCAPTCVRAVHVEALLMGSVKPDSQSDWQRFKKVIGKALEEDISPIDDVRATASYRKKVARNLICDLLQEVWEVWEYHPRRKSGR